LLLFGATAHEERGDRADQSRIRRDDEQPSKDLALGHRVVSGPRSIRERSLDLPL
jgi:hypothetical protein